MRRMRGSWFAAALVPAVFAGVVYLQAGAQTAPERQPLITEALVDAENGTLTINGFDFAGEVPTVTLGMSALPVLSVTESGVVTGLPEVLPGTYLLALSWADGAGAVFYPTLGAVGPAGPAGPRARRASLSQSSRWGRRLAAGRARWTAAERALRTTPVRPTRTTAPGRWRW